MYWALWETGGKNLVAEFDSEDEGLQAVREMLAVNKPDLLDSLVLVAMHDEDESRDVELPPVLEGEGLKSRLAALAQDEAVEAAHKVHARIRRWLAEEGWTVEGATDPIAQIKLIVKLQDGRSINILQDKDHLDHITIAQHWVFPDGFRADFAQLPVGVQRMTILDVYCAVQSTGIDIDLLGVPPTDMRYLAYVYFDGLTKDTLIQRILSVFRAYALSMRTIARGFEQAGRPSEVTSAPLRLVS
jgi:hypothetical protein